MIGRQCSPIRPKLTLSVSVAPGEAWLFYPAPTGGVICPTVKLPEGRAGGAWRTPGICQLENRSGGD